MAEAPLMSMAADLEARVLRRMTESNVDAIAQRKLNRGALRKRAATRCRRIGASAACGSDRSARRFPLPSRRARSCPASSPLKSEINPLPLMRKLADAGAGLALPVVAGRGQPLDHARHGNGASRLAAGVWGIREPTPKARGS